MLNDDWHQGHSNGLQILFKYIFNFFFKNKILFDVSLVISYFAKKKMPLIPSDYQPSFLFKNGHFSTIYSSKMRVCPELIQKRERVTLPDKDFIDIDWSFSDIPTKKVAILLHGLEGNAQRTYIKGAANTLLKENWDIAAMNFRGCSGEDNKLYQSYHSGKTDDLEAIINHILEKDNYKEIVLVGFSLGGNLLLKYLGERDIIPEEIKKELQFQYQLVCVAL